jgi:hypothetical protein
MRAIAEEASELVRGYKGAYSGEHGDGLVRSEWVAWQFGPRLTRAFEEIKDLFDPLGLMNPGKIVHPTKMDDASLFRFRPGQRAETLQTALDWSSWNVQNDPVAETLTPPGTGGDPAGGFAKAVEMCNNNGHCRKFDAGDDVPELSRDARRGAPDARPREYPAPRALRRARRRGACIGGRAQRARLVRELQRLPARVPHRRRHGENEDRGALPPAARARRRGQDRLVASLPRWALWASRFPKLANLRDTLPGAARSASRCSAFRRAARFPRGAATRFLRDLAQPEGGAAKDADVVLFVDTFTNYFEPENARAAHRVLQAAGLPRARCRRRFTDGAIRAGLCAAAATISRGACRRGEARGRSRRRCAVAVRRARRRDRRARAIVPAVACADEFLVMGLGAAGEAAFRELPSSSRSFSRASTTRDGCGSR